MKQAWLAAATVAVVAAMFAVSPGPPSPRKVNPDRVLRSSLAAAPTVPYKATQRWRFIFHGKMVETTIAVHGPTGRQSPRRMAELLTRNYTPLVEGEDTIAGRETWTLRLKPRSKYRPWRDLWIDKKTGVVLALRDWDAGNHVKRSMSVLSISYSSPNAPRVPVTFGDDWRVVDPADRGVPEKLPGGYELVSAGRSADCRADQYTYSDGLQCISVFRGFPGTSSGEQLQSRRVSGWGQGIVLSQGPVAVVGDLPVRELERIARFFR